VASDSRTKRLASTLAKLAVTAAVIAFIVWRLGWTHIVRTLAQADYRYLVAGLVIFWLSSMLGTVQWQLLLKNRGLRMPFVRAFFLYSIGMFFNNFMLGLIAGDAVKVALVGSDRASAKAGLAATFLDRFAGLMAMAGLAIVGSALLLKRGLLNDGRLSTAVLALLGTFVLFCGILAFLVSRRVQHLAFRLLQAAPAAWKPRIAAGLRQIVLEVHDRHIIVPIAALSVLIQIMRIGVHIVCAASLGLLSAANFQYFFIFVPILAMLMVVPMPFGVREGLGGSLFLLAGFSPETPEAPIVMQFLASLVGIAASLLGGAMFVFGRARQTQDGK